jgi:hypothetical protein
MLLLELQEDILDKIFNIRLDDIERSILNLEDKVKDFDIISNIKQNKLIYEMSINGELEPVGTFAIDNFIYIKNKMIISYEVYENFYDYIDIDKKFRLIVNTGKYIYEDSGGYNYTDDFDNNLFISKVYHLARYIDAFILIIKIFTKCYEDDEECTLMRFTNIISIDDIMEEYDYDIMTDKDIRYYAIDYII